MYPNDPDQIRRDYKMLDIRPLGYSRYIVGPWNLYGPAMEKVRQNTKLRGALLVANPNVPFQIKTIFFPELKEIVNNV